MENNKKTFLINYFSATFSKDFHTSKQLSSEVYDLLNNSIVYDICKELNFENLKPEWKSFVDACDPSLSRENSLEIMGSAANSSTKFAATKNFLEDNEFANFIEEQISGDLLWVKLKLAADPRLPAWAIERIADLKVTSSNVESNSYRIHVKLGENVNANAKVLENLSKSKFDEVPYAVAENPSTPVKVLEKFVCAKNKDLYELSKAAFDNGLKRGLFDIKAIEKLSKKGNGALVVSRWTSAPRDILLSLYSDTEKADDNFKIIYNIASNPSTPPDILKDIYNLSGDSRLQIAAITNNSFPAQDYCEIAGQLVSNMKSGWEKWKENSSEMDLARAISKCVHTKSEHLTILSMLDDDLKGSVCSNPSASTDQISSVWSSFDSVSKFENKVEIIAAILCNTNSPDKICDEVFAILPDLYSTSKLKEYYKCAIKYDIYYGTTYPLPCWSMLEWPLPNFANNEIGCAPKLTGARINRLQENGFDLCEEIILRAIGTRNEHILNEVDFELLVNVTKKYPEKLVNYLGRTMH